MNEKSLEQLQQEAAEATKRLAEAKAAQREKEEEEKREARRQEAARLEQAMLIRVHEALIPVWDALAAQGIVEVSKSASGWGLDINKTSMGYATYDLQLRVERETYRASHFSTRANYTGNLVLYLGDRCSSMPRIRYPQGKVGFNAKKIAQEVSKRIEAIKAHLSAEEQLALRQKQGKALLAEVRAACALPEESSLFSASLSYLVGDRGRKTVHATSPKPGCVFANVGHLEVTKEQALILHAALQRIHELGKK